MIRLRNRNNQYFDIAPGTVIRHVKENPFFSLEFGFTSDYVLPFLLPKTDRNLQLIGNLDDVQSSAVRKKIPTILEVNGSAFMVGQLNILEVTEENVNVSITRNSIEFDMSRNIDTMGLFKDNTIQTKEVRKANLEKVWPAADYKYIQTINRGINYSQGMGPNNFELISLTNYTHEATYDFLDNEAMVPYFNLVSVVRELCAANKMELRGDFKRNVEMQKTYIFNTTLLNDDAPYRLNMHGLYWGEAGRLAVYPQGYIDEPRPILANGQDEFEENFFFKLKVGQVVQFYVNRVTPIGGLVSSTLISLTLTAPQVASVSAFLDALNTVILANVTGSALINSSNDKYTPFRDYRITGSGDLMVFSPDNTRTRYADLIVFSRWTTLAIEHNSLPLNLVAAGITYNFINSDMHLPSMSANEFLTALHLGFCTMIDIDTVKGRVSIDFKKDVFNGPIVDLTNEVGYDNAQTYEPEMPIMLIWNGDDGDALQEYERKHANNYPEHDDENKQEISFAGGYLEKEAFDFNRPVLTNTVNYDMIYGNYSEGKQDFKLRFLKLLPKVSDTRGIAASSDGLTPNELYSTYWARYYEFIKNGLRVWKRLGALNRGQLADIRPKTRIRVANQKYLWRKLSTDIHSENGILETEMELINENGRSDTR